MVTMEGVGRGAAGISFNRLPDPVRGRLLAAFERSPHAPHGPPLLGWRPRPLSPGLHAALALVALVVSCVAALCGWIVARSTPQGLIVGASVAPVVALAVAAALFFVGRAVWFRLPYPQGVFVFPSYVVRTRGATLDVVPCAEVGPVRVTSVARDGRRVDRAFVAGVELDADLPAAAQARDRFESLRRQFEEARRAGDRVRLASLDPFAECSLGHPWQSATPAARGPLVRTAPRWFHVATGVGALVAGAITLGALAPHDPTPDPLPPVVTPMGRVRHGGRRR